MIISFTVAIVAYLFFRNGKIEGKTIIVLPGLAFYLSFVFTITIISRVPSYSSRYIPLLFWTYKAIANGNVKLVSEVFWNIVLFIPIGLLIMMLLKSKNRRFITVGLGIFLSSIIEIIQLLTHRGLFEFDDIVHNTLGTVLGISIYFLICLSGKKLNVKRKSSKNI